MDIDFITGLILAVNVGVNLDGNTQKNPTIYVYEEKAQEGNQTPDYKGMFGLIYSTYTPSFHLLLAHSLKIKRGDFPP